MYITYTYNKKLNNLDEDKIMECLFTDDEYEEKEFTNKVYNDLSYPRFRTFNKQFVGLQTQSIDHIRYQIDNITLAINTWLVSNEHKLAYKTFQIPKATGGKRTINAPEEDLMKFMHEIKKRLDALNVLPNDSAYAYIKHRDCKKAIERHQAQGANWFLKLDIKKFFDNCSPEFIKANLKKVFPFAILPATCYNNFISSIVKLSTLNGGLPQGTPLSPLITNWLMIPFDYQVNKLLSLREDAFYTYTRYADDLLISSSVKFDYADIITDIEAILITEGMPFELKNEKTRFGSKAGRNWNLGIMYNKDNNLTVGYRRKRRVKTMIHQWLTAPAGDANVETAQELLGEISYIQNIEPEYIEGLIKFINNKYQVSLIGTLRAYISNYSY